MSGTTTISGTLRSGLTLTTAETTITQTGKVTSSDTAVTGTSVSGLTLDNGGIISGGNSGVNWRSPWGRLHNRGSIDCYGTGSSSGGTGVTLTGGGLVNNDQGAEISGTKYGIQISAGLGTVQNAGSIASSHGDAVDLANGGTVSNASSGRLYGGLNGVYINGAPGTVTNYGVITGKTGIGVDLKAGGTLINAGSIIGAQFAVKFAAGYANRLILDPGAGFSGQIDGGNTLGATQQSTLELASGASMGTVTGAYFNFEQIIVDAGASWKVTGNRTFTAGYTVTNSGTVYDAGTLAFGGNLAGNGTFLIQQGETLIDTGTIASGQTIGFSGTTGQVNLNTSGFAGTIGKFQTGDTISLTGINDVVSYSVLNGDTLDLVRGHGGHIDLTFNTNYSTAAFNVALSGPNTVVTLNQVTCFAGGTRLDTPEGPVAVEALNIGDSVLSASGQTRTIRWIGRRRLDLTRHPEPKLVQPIRIMAGALDIGVPRRDLYVSPDHAMLLDGLLIPARLLLNGVSIRREERWQSVTYYHVELDSHDVLLAEGAAAESYLDTGNRNTFENAEGPMVLHPDLSDGQRRREAESCAPFAADAARVEPVWQRLVQRAPLLGFAPPRPVETTRDAGLQVEIAGTSYAPVAVEGRRHIFLLPRWQGELVLRSRHAAPSDRRPWVDDQRQLGVKVLRLTLAGQSGVQSIPADHPALAAGWWQTEHDAGVMARWTNGAATVAIASATPCRLEVEVAATMDYAVAEDVQEVLALSA